LSNNKIGILPDGIKELPNLETLRLDGNPITVSNPSLATCIGKDVQRELNKYFSKSEESSGFLSGGGLNEA
jgi:Leucine-rich repeat (LRR) protein